MKKPWFGWFLLFFIFCGSLNAGEVFLTLKFKRSFKLGEVLSQSANLEFRFHKGQHFCQNTFREKS